MARHVGKCGTGPVVVISYNRKVPVRVRVTNRGRCRVQILMFKAQPGGDPALTVGVKTVRPGATGSLERDLVNGVNIACRGEDPEDEPEAEPDADGNDCHFSYTISVL